MLLPKVKLDENFKMLVHQVRIVRAELSICPSAVSGINISDLLEEIIAKEVYKADYQDITTYFQKHPIDYDMAIEAIRKIAASGMFEDDNFRF